MSHRSAKTYGENDMRHTWITAALCAASLFCAVQAASPDESLPEARAYLHFSFGGKSAVADSFHYGLKLDHDRRFVDSATPPLMQLDFTPQGFDRASLNGLPMVMRLALNQEEGSTAGDMVYSSADWAMVALGVIGVGFVASESSNVDEKLATNSGGGGGGGGGGTPCVTTVPVPLPPNCTP